MNRTDIIEIIKSGSESWTQVIRAQVSEICSSPIDRSLRLPIDLVESPSFETRTRRFLSESSLYVDRHDRNGIDDEIIERIDIISERRVERANTKSQKEEMSGVGFLAAVKTFTPGGRRRRRCEKQQKVLELPPGYAMQPDVVPCWDAAPPITPPAAFLPPGYKKGFPGELIFAFAWWEVVAEQDLALP